MGVHSNPWEFTGPVNDLGKSLDLLPFHFEFTIEITSGVLDLLWTCI